MKNTNFETQKTNIKTIQNITKNISPATYDRNTLNTMYDMNHISKQKRNISFSNEMSLFAIQPSDKLLRHNPAATSEWDNSSYSYLKGESQVSSVVDQSTHELIKLFFNSRPKNANNKSSIFRHKSILKTYVGIPRIKTSINRARITIYKYDRKTVYNMNMLNKSYTLWPNKKRTKQDENLKLIRGSHTASNKLVTTNMKKGYNYLANTNNRINNTNSTFTVKRFKPSNYSPLAYEKKAVKPFSSSAKPLSPISDIQKESNNNKENPIVRKVLSLSKDTNSTILTQQNNLYIIRLSGQKSSFSGAPNLEISMPKSNKGKHNHNYIDGNGDQKMLRKSVEKIKNKVKKSKSIILNPFAIKVNKNKLSRKSVFFSGKFVRGETKDTDSNNYPIILTNVIKSYNKSNKTMVFGKHPFHNKVSGKFKTVNKVRVFTPTSYPMNNIRYWYLPVSKKSLTDKRKTNIKAVDTRRPTPKINERKGSSSSSTFNRRKITVYKKRISRGKQRKLKIKIQKGKKRILLNILRNKTFNLVFSTLKITSKSKPSVLLLKNIENYSLSFIAKIKSLKLFLSHFSNMPSSYSAPDLLVWNKIRNSLFISKKKEIISSGKKNIVKKNKKINTILLVTVWKKIRNSSNPLSTLFEAKASKKREIISPVRGNKNIFISKYKTKTNMFNKLIIPTLRVGKFLGKLYKRILPYTSYCAMIWVSYMKSNHLYLSRLTYILKKRYQKRISLNIVDLKYLYLDSYIMASAITTKLKDRKKRVLRVLKRALGAIKKPYFKIHFYNRKKTLEQANTNLLFMDRNLNMSAYSLSKNILLNKHLYKKPSNYKPRLLLYHLKHKVVTGVRLQGSGRLTRRLTASRSISKFKYMGSLQNLESSRQGISTNMLRGYMKSNLQYTNMNSYNRNGAFGVKVSVSSYYHTSAYKRNKGVEVVVLGKKGSTQSA